MASQDAMIKATRGHAELRSDLPGRTGTARLVGHEEAAKVFPRIYDRVRRCSPGFISRSEAWWDVKRLDDRPERRRGSGELNRLLLEIDGRPVGYALYRIKLEWDDVHNASQVTVLEAIGATPAVTREIWRYLLGIDWVAEIHCQLLSVDHPLFLLVQRPNRLHWRVVDGVWLRLVDVGAALSARAVTGDGPVTFDVASDPIFADNVGTWTVEDGVAKRSKRRADVRLDVQALASAYLGGFTFAELARADRVEEIARGSLERMHSTAST
ncbi:MAG: sterol carrier protein domain-containing protein [Thermoleophilia bacterium]|nr:sterol carrier protein domain-containing protein [Thermoleophilia bacterium]